MITLLLPFVMIQDVDRELFRPGVPTQLETFSGRPGVVVIEDVRTVGEVAQIRVVCVALRSGSDKSLAVKGVRLTMSDKIEPVGEGSLDYAELEGLIKAFDTIPTLLEPAPSVGSRTVRYLATGGFELAYSRSAGDKGASLWIHPNDDYYYSRASSSFFRPLKRVSPADVPKIKELFEKARATLDTM